MNDQLLCSALFYPPACFSLKGVCQEEGKEVKNSFQLGIFSSQLSCRNFCSGMTQGDAKQVPGQQTKPGLSLVKI